ncbi:hypothetical protein NJ7G_2754 [Natrinema sp. J7-2]|nr:hypothetical protein NJ7G_2754 [Natrinema sp. J7-2]
MGASALTGTDHAPLGRRNPFSVPRWTIFQCPRAGIIVLDPTQL